MRVIVVNFGELWLRGRNRGEYIRILRDNIANALGKEARLRQMHDRFLIDVEEGESEGVKAKLLHVFGISRFYVSEVCEPAQSAILESASAMLKKKASEGAKGIKLEVHRSYKGFPFDSEDVFKKVAAEARSIGIEVGGKYAEHLMISITKDAAFLSSQVYRGLGGLPVGSSGRAVVLFSGGIDSPVASFYAAKRGAMPIYVHVHPFKDNSEVRGTKIERLVRILSSFHGRAKVFCVPGYVFQAAAAKASGRYETLLFKNFLFRIAERIAAKEGAKAIYTGESLGQVASQTMANLDAAQQGVKMPILRPLVGFDKSEIISAAKAAGTYYESITAYKDVCSIRRSSAITSAKREVLRRLESEMKMSAVVSKSLKLAEAFEIG